MNDCFIVARITSTSVLFLAYGIYIVVIASSSIINSTANLNIVILARGRKKLEIGDKRMIMYMLKTNTASLFNMFACLMDIFQLIIAVSITSAAPAAIKTAKITHPFFKFIDVYFEFLSI
jgi:hypothetical protein